VKNVALIYNRVFLVCCSSFSKN